MFSKRTWVLLALLIVGWAVWHGSQTLEFVYSERATEEGLRQSKVVCGEAPSILVLSEFDEDVRGPSTASDCERLARTRALEAGGLVLLAVAVGVLGYRYGSSPPRPIDLELPRLPDGSDRVVHGRHRKP